jgi:hypothetical protein
MFCRISRGKPGTTTRTRVFPSSGTFTWPQIGNIRFAVVEPEGKFCREMLEVILYFVAFPAANRKPPSGQARGQALPGNAPGY